MLTSELLEHTYGRILVRCERRIHDIPRCQNIEGIVATKDNIRGYPIRAQ